MNADFFYRNAMGRALLQAIQACGGFRLGAWLLHTGWSKPMIRRFLREHPTDLSDYRSQTYRSYAEFFAREKKQVSVNMDETVFISPCDGLLSVYEVTEDLQLPMKGSTYRIGDLIPNEEVAAQFRGGLCLVFRLEASDYHHFCVVDDGWLSTVQFLPGMLHSVQPIACETVPVFRLNRRWWQRLESRHFGTIAQIEIGAMMVGGVDFAAKAGEVRRGQRMGNFTLAGSTIVLLLQSEIANRLALYEPFQAARNGAQEVRVHYGEGIGGMI